MALKNKVFVFDADGVAIHPWGFRDALINDHGIQPEETRPFFVDAFPACLRGEADLVSTLSPYLDDWGWRDSVEALIELWLLSENRPNDRVLAKVAELRACGYRVCLASNQEITRASFIRGEMGFEKFFDELFLSSEIGAMKPEPAFYQHVEDVLAVRPQDIFFVDDGAAYIDAAAMRGWQTLCYSSDDDLGLIAA